MEELKRSFTGLPHYNLLVGAALTLITILIIVVIVPLFTGVEDAAKISELIKNDVLILGGTITGVIGLALAWLRVTAADRQADAALKQSEAANLQAKTNAAQAEITTKRLEEEAIATREVRISESFTRALESVSPDKSDAVRVGGVVALGKIASESLEYYASCMDILAELIRRQCPLPDVKERRSPKKLDVQIALKAIGKNHSDSKEEGKIIDLSKTDLRGYQFEKGSDFTHIRFFKSNLSSATFVDVNFTRASFAHADLDSATFLNCTLNRTRFLFSNCEGIDFTNCDLSNATFTKTNLDNAGFEKSKLSRAIFSRAKNLAKIRFEQTDFSDAIGIPEEIQVLITEDS